MAVDFAFRNKAASTLTPAIGVYILADLDNVPVYVGQSRDGIRKRVRRHLTSARSDVIANRQIDVWEIAFVWEYPTRNKDEIRPIESLLFHHFNPKSQLMNGTIPPKPPKGSKVPQPSKVVQVMSNEEIKEKKHIELRLPRQAEHYAQMVGHFLAVKNSKQIARAMAAHFQRLTRYHGLMLGLGSEEEGNDDDGT